MRHSSTRLGEGQRGFSILEMMFATVILLVGLVAIAQLVPASILLNHQNRLDSSALVFAQRELDQFLDRPLSSSLFTDALGNPCNLGTPAPANQVQGNPVVVFNNQTLIDFTNPAGIPNWSFTYQDPTYFDPSRPTPIAYDVRWAVIVTGNGSTASSKRFILGVREVYGNGYFQPITLDTMVSK